MSPERSTTLGTLLTADPSLTLVGDSGTRVTGVACNTLLGDVRPGVLFAPLDLPRNEAAVIAVGAVARGAAAVLVEKSPLGLAVPEVITRNSRAALARLAAAFYRYPAREVGVIGVTGTDGKTTTTFLVDSILRTAGLSAGLIGSVGVRTGAELRHHHSLQTTPEAPYVQHLLRRMADAGIHWAIVEATSHGLALHRLDEVQFAVGAITFVTRDHLDFHRDVAAYRRAKAILFERLGDAGVAVINADDPGAREMLAYVGSARVVFFSASGRQADLRATDVEQEATGWRFTLSTSSGDIAPVVLPLLGQFNVGNALCAAGVSLAAGVPFASVVRGLEAASPVPGLLETVDAGQPFFVLVDEAKSPTQLVYALEVARQLAPGGRVILVVGGSSNNDRDRLLRKGQVAALLADYSVLTTQDPRFADPELLIAELAAGAEEGGGQRGRSFTCLADRQEAIRHALEIARPNDCVLLAGKGAENEFTWRAETRPWDEAGIAREVLSELGYSA